jgi:hypothetical protein
MHLPRSLASHDALHRRRTWPYTDRDDYVIRCERLNVGRVYRTRLPDGEAFVWSVYVNGHVVKGRAHQQHSDHPRRSRKANSRHSMSEWREGRAVEAESVTGNRKRELKPD